MFIDSTDLYAMPKGALYWYGNKDDKFVDKNYTYPSGYGYTHIAYRDDGNSLYLDAFAENKECNVGAVVDLTNISKIGCIAKGYYINNPSDIGIWFGVCDNPPSYNPKGDIMGNNIVETVVIDVSNISGEHLVSVEIRYYRYATLYALWLE